MPPWSAFHVPRRRDLALENIPASMSERAANDESRSRFELSVDAITCSLDRSSYLGSSPKWLEQGAEAAGLSKGAQDARPTWAQALRLSVDQFRCLKPCNDPRRHRSTLAIQPGRARSRAVLDISPFLHLARACPLTPQHSLLSVIVHCAPSRPSLRRAEATRRRQPRHAPTRRALMPLPHGPTFHTYPRLGPYSPSGGPWPFILWVLTWTERLFGFGASAHDALTALVRRHDNRAWCSVRKDPSVGDSKELSRIPEEVLIAIVKLSLPPTGISDDHSRKAMLIRLTKVSPWFAGAARDILLQDIVIGCSWGIPLFLKSTTPAHRLRVTTLRIGGHTRRLEQLERFHELFSCLPNVNEIWFSHCNVNLACLTIFRSELGCAAFATFGNLTESAQIFAQSSWTSLQM